VDAFLTLRRFSFFQTAPLETLARSAAHSFSTN